jgi:hypothetical protein
MTAETADTETVLRQAIARNEGEIAHLRDRYGDGVRPAWVGEEIGYLTMLIGQAKTELREVWGIVS